MSSGIRVINHSSSKMDFHVDMDHSADIPTWIDPVELGQSIGISLLQTTQEIVVFGSGGEM